MKDPGGAPGQGGAQGGRGAQGAGGCRREDPGGAQGQGGAQGGRGAQGAGGCRREDPGGAPGQGGARISPLAIPLKPSSPSTVHRSSSSTRPTPTTRKPSESLVTSSPSRASAPSTSESRVSASCKKLGIDPAAVAAQLAAFPAPQIEIPLRSGVPPRTPPPSRVSCCSRTVRCPSAFVPSLSFATCDWRRNSRRRRRR